MYTKTVSPDIAFTHSGEPIIHDEFETTTGTWQYIVADPSTRRAAIVDPVLDFDPATQSISTDSANKLLNLIGQKGYSIDWILETHAHADHLTSSFYLRTQLGRVQNHVPSVGIGKRIDQVQNMFAQRYMVPPKEYTAVFDKLFDDDEKFFIGNLEAAAIHLPGHTPDHMGYQIANNVFCGDSIFHPDIGTARCDFPGGSAKALFDSGRKLLSLSDDVKIWTGHDYPPAGRDKPVPFMTVKEHGEQNKHLKSGISEEEFVKLRHERDAALAAPRLLHQSLQINIRAGRLPEPTDAENVI
ncbi:putative metallo-beta-lactamase domain protein [Corynespora cassiicola Philippines]|uniref:Putative metallo-beta-lactamase domain protein n=1 Tax=Corynespora cassiicola Philippines TaxID=1448308 RepID=A0A2T2NQ57_CORCC|nr:putative metallo-beta-lactamase domain protein [Corynespora cassiicola Philippines]